MSIHGIKPIERELSSSITPKVNYSIRIHVSFASIASAFDLYVTLDHSLLSKLVVLGPRDHSIAVESCHGTASCNPVPIPDLIPRR